MDGDSLASALTHGGALLGGGGATAWIVRLFFGDVSKRLDKIERTLEQLGEKEQARYAETFKEIGKVEKTAQAAFSKYDDLKKDIERLEEDLRDLRRGRKR